MGGGALGGGANFPGGCCGNLPGGCGSTPGGGGNFPGGGANLNLLWGGGAATGGNGVLSTSPPMPLSFPS